MNLKFKFLLFVSLIIIFIFTVTTIILSIVLSYNTHNELVYRDTVIAERIVPDLANNLGDYYTYDFTTYAASIQNLFNKYPDLTHFRIYNPQGEIIVDSSEVTNKKNKNTTTHKKINDKQTLALIASQKTFQDFGQYNSQRTIKIFAPFIDNYGIYRLMVEYDFSLQSVNKSIMQTTGLLIFIGVISILIGIGLTYFLIGKVTKPIESLIIGAREISNGNLDYTIPPVNTHDEIEQLSEAFNAMAKKLSFSYQGLEEQVKQRTEELEKAKTGLEEQVKQRTTALVAAKIDLETKVAARTDELQKKVTELERMNKIMIDRELKMVELKKELAQIKSSMPEQADPKELPPDDTSK